MPKAIEWLEKGMLYCEPYSAYELALIYLYNDEYKKDVYKRQTEVFVHN